MAKFVQFGSRVINPDHVTFVVRVGHGQVNVHLSTYSENPGRVPGLSSAAGLLMFKKQRAERVWNYFTGESSGDEFKDLEAEHPADDPPV